MARRSKPDAVPARSRKALTPLVAFARATGDGSDDPDTDTSDKDADAPASEESSAKPADAPAARPVEPAKPAAEAKPAEPPKPAAEAKPVEPPKPAAAPVAAEKQDEPIGPIYEPLPKPKEIPVEDPEAAAPPPGTVPRGDSRSLRKTTAAGEEFVLIYRFQTFVISRAGLVGKRGRWKVVEYPTMGHASHAYAQECSRLQTDGFSDFRG